ncbi:MAG: glycosyltransferase [Thermacetogeniaceae bacterium]
MKFSLILCTINRYDELNNFLFSLNTQIYNNFELIIVDQNSDMHVKSIIAKYNYDIIYLKSEPGLSKARNVALKYVSGDIIAFPDDDCEYPKELLKSVNDFFVKYYEYDAISGRSVDARGRTSVSHFDIAPGIITIDNVFKRANSITIFLKNKLVESTGYFDEQLGLGAKSPFLASEEIDYLIRAIKYGYKIYFDPSIIIFHNEPVKEYSEIIILRGYFYGAGYGRVARKHMLSSKHVFLMFIRPLGGFLLSLFFLRWKKARYHFFVLKGRLMGWFA